jgi:hypothetical protein
VQRLAELRVLIGAVVFLQEGAGLGEMAALRCCGRRWRVDVGCPDDRCPSDTVRPAETTA